MSVLSLSYKESYVTITNTSQSLLHIMAGNSWHRFMIDLGLVKDLRFYVPFDTK